MAVLAVVSVLLLGLQGCGSGSDGPSAKDQACTAKDDLSTSIKTVVDDVKAGNLGNARDHLGAVRSSASDLASAVSDLGSQQRKTLQPQVDEIRGELESLSNATSLTELSAGVSALTSSASTLFSDLGDDLGCD